MNEINGKIFIENATGEHFFGISKATDTSWGVSSTLEGLHKVVFCALGADSSEWFVMNADEFFQDFTEAVSEAE